MIKVGVVGYGLSATAFHLPFLESNPKFQVLGVVKRDVTKEIPELSQNNITLHPTLDHLLTSHPTLDLVVITSPSELHYEQAKIVCFSFFFLLFFLLSFIYFAQFLCFF